MSRELILVSSGIDVIICYQLIKKQYVQDSLSDKFTVFEKIKNIDT